MENNISYLKYFPILSLIFILITGGCKINEKQDGANIISVSILPQKYFVSRIAGDDYQINVLIPSGSSPANYDPSPRQMENLSNSDIYLKIGHIIFEKVWIDRFNRNHPDIKFFDLSAGINLIQTNVAHGDHYHKGADPHTWMSVKNSFTIAQNTYNALVESFPEDSAIFKNNYKKLQDTLSALDSYYQSLAPVLKGKDFLVYHPALAYLARDYGMTQHVLEFEGKEPPPAHIANIIRTAKENEIGRIFIQSQFSRDNAASLAKEINAKVIEIDPLNENWPEEMRKILSHLIE